jgi:glycosidase
MEAIVSRVKHPDWTRNAVLYELNVRQFSPEGTLAAIMPQLPRLREMGIDIVWLMPVNPIGEAERKGTLGSNYAVRDYKAVNPDFGTMADLCELVAAAHRLGMHVILDWVANHTAWDHVWVTEHPDWYLKNPEGQIEAYRYQPPEDAPEEIWSDVVGLDYRQAALWEAMTDALLYFVREADVDGYRCDVAGLLPTAFWEQARRELEKIKPVFMLAEWSSPELHRAAFDMTYDWGLYDVMSSMARGEASVFDLCRYLQQPPVLYPADAYRMLFTTNHDKNSWVAHDAELFGPAFRAFTVLTATLPGMMLIYSGQEAGLHKRLQFFEKDPIDWGTFELAGFYRELTSLKHRNRALWHGEAGGTLTILPQTTRTFLAFSREKEGNRVTVLINFSRRSRTVAASDRWPALKLQPFASRIFAEQAGS